MPHAHLFALALATHMIPNYSYEHGRGAWGVTFLH